MTPPYTCAAHLLRFYDSIYTERYMKTPKMNPEGYANSAVTNMEGFKNAKFLLVHGTGDVAEVLDELEHHAFVRAIVDCELDRKLEDAKDRT